MKIEIKEVIDKREKKRYPRKYFMIYQNGLDFLRAQRIIL